MTFIEMTKKYKDSDILKAMSYLNDYDSVVYGANGHYGVGAMYDLFDEYTKSDKTEAAKILAKESGIDDDLTKAAWLVY